ncbi:MAG: hypothetical protein HZA23_07650 [Nitrospirae bacterium]|nr:hypothetical protein [Nitrospirota bacterium]
MFPWDQIRSNAVRGVEALRRMSALFAERVAVESVVAKLLFRAQGLEERRGDLLRQLGERVYALQQGKDALRDGEVSVLVEEIRAVGEQIEALRQEIQEATKGSGRV